MIKIKEEIMSNYAYISVLTTESYLIGILGVAKCLEKVQAQFPFYVLITDNISIEIENLLNNYRIHTIRKKSIIIPEIIRKKMIKVFFLIGQTLLINFLFLN